MKSRLAVSLVISILIASVLAASYLGYATVIAKPTHGFTLTVSGKAYDPQKHVYVNVVLSVTGTADGDLKTVICLYVKGGDVSITNYGTFSVSGGSGQLVWPCNYIALSIWLTPKYGGKAALWCMSGRTGTLWGQTLDVSLYSCHVILPLKGSPRLDDLYLTGTITPVYTVPKPKVNSFAVSPNPFSPNGDGSKDTSTITATFNVAVSWNLQVKSSSGTVLRTWTGTGSGLSLIWDGKNNNGFKVPDGVYTVRLSGTDMSGVTFTTASVTVTVDTKLPTVTGVSVTPTSFKPRIGQTTRIAYTLSESCYVTIKIYNNAATLVRTLADNALQSKGYHGVIWNGKNSWNTIVPPGTYTIKISVADKAGNKASPYPIIKTVIVT